MCVCVCVCVCVRACTRQVKGTQRLADRADATSLGIHVGSGIRQHASAYVSTRQHTSAHVSIRRHTLAYELMQYLLEFMLDLARRLLRQTLYFCTSKASKLRTWPSGWGPILSSKFALNPAVRATSFTTCEAEAGGVWGGVTTGGFTCHL